MKYLTTLSVLLFACAFTSQANDLPDVGNYAITIPRLPVKAEGIRVIVDAVEITDRYDRSAAEYAELNPQSPFKKLEKWQPQPLPPRPNKVWDWRMKAMAGGVVVASGFDWHSTRKALTACPTCKEGNPIYKPFAHNDYALGGAVLAVDGLSIWSMTKLKAQGKSYWWVPGAVKIVGHLVATKLNYNLANTARRCRVTQFGTIC